MEPIAVVFSGPNFLSINLVAKLVEKKCFVYIATREKDRWEKVNLPNKNLVRVVDYSELPKGASYSFFIEGVDDQNVLLTKEEIGKAFEFIRVSGANSVVVLPYLTSKTSDRSVSSTLDHFLRNDSKNLSLVYTGEIYGEGMNLSQRGFIANTFKGLANGKVTVPGYDFDVYPIYVTNLVDLLIRGVFSYGFEKRRMVITGKISGYEFLRIIQKIAPWVVFERSSLVKKQATVPVFDLSLVPIHEQAILQTANWAKSVRPAKVAEVKQVRKVVKPLPRPKIKRQVKVPKVKLNLKRKIDGVVPGSLAKKSKIFRKKLIVVAIVLILWVLSLPFFSLFASGISLKLAANNLVNSRVSSTERFLNLSNFFAGLAKGEFGILRATPVIGKALFDASYQASDILLEGGHLGKEGLTVYTDMVSILKGVVSDSDYNLPVISERAYLNLDSIYKKSSFLETEINDFGYLAKNMFPQLKSMATYRKYLLEASVIVHKLPVLLGFDVKKTYLVLFQNNMELRPTGGFIGSFALVTFDRGKLVDTSVYDVYSADGQLKGHVEPPAPIKNYLGEANWWLRDSNWDPDFVTSAQRAEWFVEKEFDRNVDGVVGVDLSVVREILKETGPIDLADVNMQVDYKNLFQKIQFEVESQFFPGSQKKATILTSLEKSLVDKLPSLVTDPKLGFTFLSLLKEKHLQIFLHDKDAQNAISDLNFGGEVKPDECGGNCMNLWFGLVEANLGVNKVNYYITRDTKINVNVKEKNIESTITLKVTNSSATNTPLAGNYKNYVRLVAPNDSYFDKVTIIGNDGTKVVAPETSKVNGYIEVGVLVDIAPKETKSIVFSVNTANTADLSREGSLSFYWRKQAGIESYPANFKITLPSSKKYTINAVSPVTLTRVNEVSYNTDLRADLEAKINWK
ncbi:MAG TPA: DUF4012 domain-containing protein [Patescibacteria group bacterium]